MEFKLKVNFCVYIICIICIYFIYVFLSIDYLIFDILKCYYIIYVIYLNLYKKIFVKFWVLYCKVLSLLDSVQILCFQINEWL